MSTASHAILCEERLGKGAPWALSWIPALEAPAEVLDGIYVVEISGSLFFGNAGPLQRKLGGLESVVAIVLHMGAVRYLDQSGVFALSDIIEDMRASGTVIFLTELNPEPFELLTRLGVTPRIIDHDHMFRSAEEAVTAAMSARRES